MRIGIVGSGDVGRTLGGGFVARGHDVKIGSRDPHSAKLAHWLTAVGPRASSGTFAEAAAYGEMLVLSTAWSGTRNAIDLAGRDRFDGKIVVDTTNPLVLHEGGPPTLAVGHTDSAGETVQRWLHGARVVKAFNSVGYAHMIDPGFPGGPAEMFLCGDDPQANRTVAEIVMSFGWTPVDLGGIEASRYLEPLAMIWILHGFRAGTWNHAFRLVRR